MIRGLVAIVLFTVACFVLLMVVVGHGFIVEGDCMQPGMHSGDRVMGDKWSMRLRSPRRGEVIIFRQPGPSGALYIKRVIAVGGETVAIRDGVVHVNGQPLPEPYLPAVAPVDFAERFIPEGSLFVMGDNRDVSDDSRNWGEVPARAVVARAAFRYWPPLIDNHDRRNDLQYAIRR